MLIRATGNLKLSSFFYCPPPRMVVSNIRKCPPSVQCLQSFVDYAGYCFSKITSYFLVCDSNRIFLSIFKSVCISWKFFIHRHLDFLFLGSLQCSVWVLVIGAPVRTSVNSRACSLPTSARQNRFEHVTPVHRLSKAPPAPTSSSWSAW